MGRALRPRSRGRVRDPDRDRAGNHPPARGETFAARKSRHRTVHAGHRRLRSLSSGEGIDQHFPRHRKLEGNFPQGRSVPGRSDPARPEFRAGLLLAGHRRRQSLLVWARPYAGADRDGAGVGRTRARAHSRFRRSASGAGPGLLSRETRLHARLCRAGAREPDVAEQRGSLFAGRRHRAAPGPLGRRVEKSRKSGRARSAKSEKRERAFPRLRFIASLR